MTEDWEAIRQCWWLLAARVAAGCNREERRRWIAWWEEQQTDRHVHGAGIRGRRITEQPSGGGKR